MQTKHTTLPPSIKQALNRRFERIVVFSGAGMSAESGIPTFRSGQNSLWSEFNPADLACPDAWAANNAMVWGWYEWRRGLIQRAQPNPAHFAVARLQTALGATAITQNVDDLHERAGVQNVTHLHGSMLAPRCATCGQPHAFSAPPSDEPLREIAPPVCPHCQGSIRPGVVWFGEILDGKLLSKAKKLIQECDLLLVVGTSGHVHPAAGLVELAPASAVVIEINPEESRKSQRNLHLKTTAASGLQDLVELLLTASAPKL